MRIVLLAGLFLSSTIAVADAPKAVSVDEASSAAVFTAVGNPGFLKIVGHGAKVTGGCKAGACVFESDLTALETGIGLRDKHMKEKYLQTDKYPKAKLEVKQLAATGDTTGKLTLHGVTKEVPIHAVVEPRGGGAASVVAEMQLKLTDFGLAIPSYLGVTVAENVTVTASFVAK